MHIELGEYLFGIVPIILQSVIAVVMLRRKLFKQFGVFLTYTVYQVITIIVIYAELAFQVSSLHYAYTYYPLQVCSTVLSYAVIYEVFRVVLEPYDALRRVWRILFATCALILGLVALLWVLDGSGAQSDRLTESMTLLQRSLTVVQAGLLLLLFVLSGSLGLTWRSYSFGVALGYGTFAIVELVLWALRARYGDQFWASQSTLNSVAYNLMILIWGCYILQPQRIAQPVRVIPYNDIAKWNEKLEELLKKKAA